MLSVAKLTLGQEAYYEQQVAGGLDDYYAGRGESPGVWAGVEAASLGLVGVVGDGDLGTLLRGIDPASGDRLREPVRPRAITARVLDVETGEWRDEEKLLSPVTGYDLVFSCPKSVSLLHALTEDEHVRREISETHEAAWQAALGYLERAACVVRRGHGGTLREHGSGFVAAAFRHRTSRAQDPHLHTHVIVANMTLTEDGEWRALDGAAILKTYRLAAGYLYEAQLRRELTRRLGLEWTEPVKGMGELARVPEKAIRAFSTRRQSLVEHMQEHGTEGFAAARVAALATREAKELVDLPRLRQEWQARAAEHGLGRRELAQLTAERAQYPVRPVEREELAARLFAPDGLTARQTTFSLPELVQAIAGAQRDGAPVAQVLEETQVLASLPGIELVDRGEPGRPSRFTTRELLAVEGEALELAAAGRDAGAPSLDRAVLARTLMQSGRGLSGEQRMLVHEASCRADRVVCVVGVAGAGKTTALLALADGHRQGGIEVLGAAPSGRAADELEAATGIASRTIHRLLFDAGEQPLPRGCLLVVDEAGMAETRVLAPLLRLVDEAEGKALLVGDPAQLPAVGAGGLFPALCEQLGVIELGGNRRQRDPLERQALARLRDGEPEPYLAHAARNGRLTIDEDPIKAKQRLLHDWWRSDDRFRSVMLAYRREDVGDLNEAAHRLMLRDGRLGREAVAFGGREFRTGDRVVCRQNDAGLGVRNGTRGTIVDLDEFVLTVRDDSGTRRQLPLTYASDHLDHGYALTGHGVQGATVDRVYVLLRDQGALREWGYVACTRARTETRLYVAGTAPIDFDTHIRGPEPSAPTERAARALERPAAQPLAVEQAAPHETTTRLLARQREQLDRRRARTERQLAAAEREREHLGWWNRGSRRTELENEIALHRTSLRLADEKRAQLERESLPSPPLPQSARERDDLAQRYPRPERRALEREPPRLEL